MTPLDRAISLPIWTGPVRAEPLGGGITNITGQALLPVRIQLLEKMAVLLRHLNIAVNLQRVGFNQAGKLAGLA